MKIDIVLRTCSNSLLTPNELKRVCGDNRQVLIRKCFHSLVRAIKNSTHEFNLTVLDDHSDKHFIDFIRSFEGEVNMSIISLKERGPNHSAWEQFNEASLRNNLVYVVEDDYLHEEDALEFMVGAYTNFVRRYNTDVIIYPYDCSLRYNEGQESLTTLYHDGVRYWRSVDKTANTMLVHPMVLRENWSVFENLARNYPKVLEDDTINKLYYSQENKEASIRVFSPIPSIAYHVGYSQPTSINTTHLSWNHLWERVEDWELVQGWFYNPDFYNHIVNSLPSGSKIAEIGAWRGKSTCCLASYIKRSNKDIKLYSIDTWKGSDEQTHRDIINNLTGTLFDDYMSNLRMCSIEDVVTPVQKLSVEASKDFGDKSLDVVIIDGAHDYDSVRADIESWLPKIKTGGLISGDDFSDSWPGVKKAVTEKFGDSINVHNNFWYVSV